MGAAARKTSQVGLNAPPEAVQAVLARVDEHGEGKEGNEEMRMAAPMVATHLPNFRAVITDDAYQMNSRPKTYCQDSDS
jgi:hypothetical protein